MNERDQLDYDYIVIGSGFGGKVSALRLSEKGYSVAVLEKGKRWQKEDFPKTNWNARKYLWLPQLGNYVRTNSEAILGVMSRDKSVDWNDQIAITSGIYADDTTHIEMVRYNKGSDALLNLLTLMTDGGGIIPRGVRYLGQIVRHPLRFVKLLWPLGKAASTTIVLVMQTDENYLKLDYKPRWWRLGGYSMNSVTPPGQKRAPAYIPIANEVTRCLAKKMDGLPLSLLSEAAFNASTTAHILGGCCMGSSPEKGVVGTNGEVFGYPNMFIADGSVVPANLGVNPSLTITALSEYIISQIKDR